MADWIQNVDKEMEKKGTVGAFTKQATDAGMSVQDFAKKVKDNPNDFSERTRERAQFALNMQQIANKKKMAKGGETDKPQGYNDKLNEDLGTRLGRESSYKQTLKDRRDESKAANKNLGRRAYSSVETMDNGDRMFMEGGKTQGYDDRDRESIGERNRGKKSQSLDSRMRESAGTEKSMGRRKYADVSTMDKGKRKMARGGSVKGGYVIKGRTKNKNFFASNKDMPFKSKAEAEKEAENLNYYLNSDSIYDGKNSQEQLKEQFRLKDNIKEFYTEKQYARGGSVKGKIDRDRYVKLRREKDKEIAKLKKEKGALRKETITKDKCDDKIEKVEAKTVVSTEDNNNQTLLVGGIAGILLGAFFIGR